MGAPNHLPFNLPLKLLRERSILVNNAGSGLVGAIEECSIEEVQAQFAVNVSGPLTLIKAVLPGMRARRQGHIINVSSVGAFSAGSGSGIYCAMKAALVRISEALREECAPLGIKVTLAAPGGFRTDFASDRSIALAQRHIDDYAETVGSKRTHTGSGNEQGDPARFPGPILAVARMEKPPFLLALGSQAADVIIDSSAALIKSVGENIELSRSTDLSVSSSAEAIGSRVVTDASATFAV